MSLDKLKLGWDSLADSVDQKEIVVMKNLRRDLYNEKYDSLRGRYSLWGLAFGLLILFIFPFPHIFSNEINILAIIAYYVAYAVFAIIGCTLSIKFNQIKMNEDVRALKSRFCDYLNYSKMVDRICAFILVPVGYASYIWLKEGTAEIIESPFRYFAFPLLVMSSICYFLAFYGIKRRNKKLNRMLEDIKQLEEFDAD